MAGYDDKAGTSSEFPDYYRTRSRRLLKVLEDVGVSVAVRDLLVKTKTTAEILLTIQNYLKENLQDFNSEEKQHIISTYIFGSQFEGTTTPGLESDMDKVCVFEAEPVVTNIFVAQQHDQCYLLVQDACTPAGYAKLQRVIDGVLDFAHVNYRNSNSDADILQADAQGRMVITVLHERFQSAGKVWHGPASNTAASDTACALDTVFALSCRKWPDCAMEWLSRQRNHNWPTQEQIEKCKTLGCFFVRVEHPDSNENHLQWRLSFSLQERLLVTDFNSAQLKCYVLVKMIKNEIIHRRLGEKSVTSYQFKTCILYMIESTPANFWVENNLLVCLYKILESMLTYIETGICPNYFIPAENMFEGRIYGQLQIKLRELLTKLLSEDFKFLMTIKTDKLGERYQEALACAVTSRYPSVPEYIPVEFAHNMLDRVIRARNSVLLLCHNNRIQTVAKKHLRTISIIQTLDRVTDHSREETRAALSLLEPDIDTTFMSVLVVLAKHLSKSKHFMLNMLRSEKWDALRCGAQQACSKLKQGTFLYMLGYNEMSLEILNALQDCLGHQPSYCCCSEALSNNVRYKTQAATSFLDSKAATYEEACHLVVQCVIFVPVERDLTPLALCYEMDRSVGSPPENKEDWHDWAVVDGKVLLYFLLYLNHQQLGMEAHASVDMDNIRWLIQTDKLLGHTETAFNLLGWIYKERGHVDKAVECFQKSLTIQSTHNAAIWLLACVLCAKVNSTGVRH